MSKGLFIGAGAVCSVLGGTICWGGLPFPLLAPLKFLSRLHLPGHDRVSSVHLVSRGLGSPFQTIQHVSPTGTVPSPGPNGWALTLSPSLSFHLLGQQDGQAQLVPLALCPEGLAAA